MRAPDHRPIRVLFLWLVLLLLAGSPSRTAASPSREVETPVPVHGPNDPPDGIAVAGWQSILRQIAAADLEAELAHLDDEPLRWRFTNRSKTFEASFGTQGMSVSPLGRGEASWTWGLALIGFGPVGAAVLVAPVEPRADGNCVEYRRPGLTEWYLNDHRGLEHGFTILESIAGNPSRLELVLELSGSLKPAISKDAAGLTLRDADGKTVLGYSGLHAFDATGRTLAARMELLSVANGAQHLRIEFDVVGAAFPVVVDPLISTQVKKLTAADAAIADQLGISVAISGDTAVVGANADGDAGTFSGSAYVFERNTGGADNWGQVKKLTASDAAAEDEFGYSVTISGDTIVIGAPQDDDGGSSSGSAYVFERNTGGMNNWGQVKKLIGSDDAASDQFGISVSISGHTVVVGAFVGEVAAADSGSAYVFERNTGGADNWGQVKELTAADAATNDSFGLSVSISGDTVVAGARFDDDAGSASGSACVFARNAGGVNNWGQVKKLTAIDAASGDSFGRSVSISGDTVVVGANADDDAGVSSGSAYLFERNAGGADNWGQVKKLTAADGVTNDQFGYFVSIGGDTVVVGAPFDDDAGTSSGSAYVFERNTEGADNWGQVTKLSAADAAAGDRFGESLSISGDTIVLGAPFDDDAGTASGSAYIFTIAGCEWNEIGEPVAADGASGDAFGRSVSISGDTAIVGASGDDDAGTSSGSAYVFERNRLGVNNWGQVKKLAAADAAVADTFGHSVSISGDTAVVGAPSDDDLGTSSGSAYVFERNAGGADNWGQVKKLTPSDGATFDTFGTSVSMSGDTVVVGANADDDGGSNSGSVYVFRRNTGGPDNWGQVRKMIASDAAAGDAFGHSLSISGDTVVVGAWSNDDVGSDSGSAYVFERNTGGSDNWGQVKKLTASDAAAEDQFGVFVSISGATVLVGARFDDDAGSSSGSAYAFERNTGGVNNWGEVKKLTAVDAAGGDRFGEFVSISGDTAVVGASQDDAAAVDSGSAYAFERNAGGADNWGQVKKLTAADAATGDLFGYSVSISGDSIIVGSLSADAAGANSGSAYTFEFACTGAPGEASPSNNMLADRAGTNIDVTFAPACSAIDHAVYWGQGPIGGSLQWVGSACGLGTTGSASFDPGVALLPGQWLYFVVVGYNAVGEGSYGVSSAPVERLEAVGIGVCDRPVGPSSCP